MPNFAPKNPEIDPMQIPVHPDVGNKEHANNPHYNIKLPNGKKAAIIIVVGYVREIVIMQEYVVRVEFNVYNHEYGGIEFYFTYEDYNSLILSIEMYLNKKICTWENIIKTGYYPDINELYDIHKSTEILKNDFINDKLDLPTGYLKKRITWRILGETV